jgi:hypothetical protein
MKKQFSLVLVILLIALSGCALKPATWSKRGISMAQGEKDLAECSKKANLLNIYGDKYDDGVFYVAGSVLGEDPDKPGVIFQKCMKEKGYKKVQ